MTMFTAEKLIEEIKDQIKIRERWITDFRNEISKNELKIGEAEQEIIEMQNTLMKLSKEEKI